MTSHGSSFFGNSDLVAAFFGRDKNNGSISNHVPFQGNVDNSSNVNSSNYGVSSGALGGEFTDPYVILCLVLVALSGLSPCFVGIAESSTGEYDAALALNMSADVLATLGVLLNWCWGANAEAEFGSLPALRIHEAYAIVEGLEFTVGFGPPYDGVDFKAGSEQFAAFREQLKPAFPDSGWQSLAAQAYADLVVGLRDSAQTLADVDLELAAVAQDQAGWVSHMRLGFGILKILLVIGAGAATAASYRFIYLPNLLFVANLCAGMGVGLAIGMVAALGGISGSQEDRLKQLISDYQQIGTGSATVGGFDAIAVKS